MKAFLRSVVAGLLAVLLTVPASFAEERRAFSQEELDQMLAPIALYPDPLLTQILMAATYPLEVVQAARWSRSNSHLQGREAVRAVENMDWDASVKSLVAVPQILQRMDEQLEWTQRLGEAFLEQEPHVMDAIQGLRQRAERAGTLRSNEQMRVTRQDEAIVIEPAQPQVVYVPYYDPGVVYGPWWWPAYPPVYWGPPPGYYAWPAYAPGFFWGPAIAISWGFFFGHADWHHHHVKVVHTAPYHYAHVGPAAPPVKWQHDPVHRRNVPYRYTVSRQPFGQHTGARGDDRGRPEVRHDARGIQPQVRNAAPQARSGPAAPNPRPERITPQPRDRWTDRSPRNESPRPQARAPEPRPNFAAPPVGTVPRPSPSAGPVGTVPRPSPSAPVARAEPRPYPPAAQARSVPRQQFEPARRAEPRNPGHERFAPPRASVGGPVHMPRFDGGNLPHGGARTYGGGNLRQGSAMGGGRRS